MTTRDTGATWRVYGIRHAVNRDRTRGQNFILEADPSAPLVLDFYSWVLIGEAGTIVVDTGMDPRFAAKHGHTYLISPVEGLARLGVVAAEVETVVLTHAHYDHLGFLGAFPKARFLMQAEEMAYVTGPWMEKSWFRRAYEPEEIQRLVALLHAGRLHLHGREMRVADGVSVHWVGGHCAGQEVVRVRTGRGWVVLASDALHYYEEYERGVPFAIVFNSSDMIAAHDTIRALADSDTHVLPGHDPRIAAIYPAAEGAGSEHISEHILRLDVAPVDGAAP
jgi:glyoxylase-like metal-dependent hydrolase (beta-lactamase superfamily II)